MKARIALQTVLLVAGLSCGGGGGGGSGASGGGGGTGGLGGSSGAGGSSAPGCTSCRSDEVCVQGQCTHVPSSCPCPKETYCDLGTSACVVGCAQDQDCDTARVCNTTTRQCFNGCHADTACAAGQICDDATSTCRPGCRTTAQCPTDTVCLDTMCQTGCVTTDDCKATGQTCVSNACACPSGQSVCSGACVPLDTVQNCGACGMTCAKNAACSAGQCSCPALTCQPQVVFSDGNPIARIWIDGGYVYTSETNAGVITILRAPVGGGTIQTMGTLGKSGSLGRVAIGGGSVVYYDRGADSSNRTVGYVYRIASPGAQPSALDMFTTPANDAYVGADATNAYWSRSTGTTGSITNELIQENLTTLQRQTLGNLADYNFMGIVATGGSVYVGLGLTNYRFQRATGTNNITTVYTAPTGVILTAFTVDSAGIYISQVNSSIMAPGKVFRINLNGMSPADLVSGTITSFATDATNLYYIPSETGGPVYRVAKAGGQAGQQFYGPTTGSATWVAVDGGYVYFIANNQVQRLSTSYVP